MESRMQQHSSKYLPADTPTPDPGGEVQKVKIKLF